MAYLLVYGAITVIFVTLLAWIVFKDPKGKWPDASPLRRLVNVLTFRR